MKRLVAGLGVTLLASCSSTAKPSATPTTQHESVDAPPKDVVAAAFKPVMVDQGEFGHYLGNRMIGAEVFKVERNGLGYRITSRFESHQGRTELELFTDLNFGTMGGTLTAKMPAPPPSPSSNGGGGNGSSAPPAELELTSELSRDDKGNLVSAFNNGREIETKTSLRPVDWFIGGPFAAILLPLCGVTGTETKSYLIFPDDTVDVFAATALVLDGKRTVNIRRARFASSGKTFYVACEGGNIVGHRSGKMVSARRDDASVQAALTKLPD